MAASESSVHTQGLGGNDSPGRARNANAPQRQRPVQLDQRRIAVLGGPLAALGVGILAAGLTVAQGLPFGHDSMRHIYRLVERDDLIRQGVLFTRWSPHWGYGYGFPLFNYYPQLLYYLAEPFQLAGFGPLLSLRIALALALVTGALGMYSWVNRLFGPGAGLVAATAFLFSPYLMYTLIIRTGWPEFLALMWMPWALWALLQFHDKGGAGWSSATALFVALVWLAHLFSAALFTATLLLYSVVLAAAGRPARPALFWLARPGSAIGLGLGLAAFFWLPAILESSLIQVERMLEIADPATGKGVIPLWQAFVGPLSPGAALPIARVPPRLSLLAACLALLGAVTGLAALRLRLHRAHIGLAAILSGLCLFMLTPTSLWLWQGLPMLRLAQFPFRFLGLASLWLALLAAAGVAAILALLPQAAWWRRPAGAGIVLLAAGSLALYALRWPPLAYHQPDTPVDLLAALTIERTDKMMGMMPRAEYLPRSVRVHPPAHVQPLLDGPRLVEQSLPPGARVLAAKYGLFHYSLALDSPQPWQAVFHTFYFPGWWAKIDGRVAAVSPTGPYGLLTVPVPAGRSQVTVGFGPTPVRRLAVFLSLVSAIMLLYLSIAPVAGRPLQRVAKLLCCALRF